MSDTTLALFLTAAAVLAVIPGPAVLYVTARSIEQGRLAGLVSVAGIAVGTLFHIAAAALGISAILVNSALAFSIVKYAGAAYLVYLGIQRLRDQGDVAEAAVRPASLRRAFAEGVAVNLLNPKTALFFFAFLPQFVDPTRGSVVMQTIVLGLLFLALAFVSDSAYAIVAGSAANWLRTRQRAVRRVTGGVYLALGVMAATARRR